MSPDVQTRHHLPLETLQAYLVKSLAKTEFEPTGSSDASPSKQVGWNELQKVKQFSFGQSNPTYLLVDTKDNHLVLRARPSGRLISTTAHNLHREFTVLSRLNAYNQYLSSHRSSLGESAIEDWLVPVPRTYGYYPGDEKRPEGQPEVGMPEFYVMEFKEGNVFEDCEFPELDDEKEKEECWKLAIRTLTILSTLPLDVLDLPASFGPPPHIPVPFYERQVRGLLRVSQAQGSTSIPPERRKDHRGRPYNREKTGPIEGEQVMVPYLARGAKQLGAEEKAQGTWSLVHGDYKIDNLIFGRSKKDGKWRVVGVLDWELCTLGSPLSDLANLTLPHSIDPHDVPREFMPNSISFERLRKKENPSTPDANLPGTANLLKGLNNIPKDILCVPHVSELEAYWVECMKRGEDWNDKVMRVWEKEGGKRTESTPVRPQGKSRWDYPIKGLGWVRSWMLWRLAIISQGISARAALGQASSASAQVDSTFFDLFGRLAAKCKESDKETRDEEPKAKL